MEKILFIVELFIFIFIFPSNVAKIYMPFRSWEIDYNFFYGFDNFSMKNVFLLPTIEELSSPIDETPSKDDIYEEDEIDVHSFVGGVLDPRSTFYDVVDFNEIREGLYNISEEIVLSNSRRKLDNTVSPPWFLDLTDPTFPSWLEKHPSYANTNEENERVEIQRVRSFTVTYLLQARYKMNQIMKYRNVCLEDDRYKLGYLFNRLRRFLYDMRKILVSMYGMEADAESRDFDRSVRLYRVLVRRQVDVKDCLRYIRYLSAQMTWKAEDATEPPDTDGDEN